MSKTSDVDDSQLLEDYRNTEKEYKAYRNLATGYETLAELPENQGVSNSHRTNARNYRAKEKECYEFFLFLEKIKNERGL